MKKFHVHRDSTLDKDLYGFIISAAHVWDVQKDRPAYKCQGRIRFCALILYLVTK